MMPKKIRYQATRIDTTYRVIDGQTKVRIPAAIPKIPPMMSSGRHICTRPAAASWVMPPNTKATPTKAATAVRLPTRYDSTYMPNQTHRTPRSTNHHQIADASRTPVRIASRSGVEDVASLAMATSFAAGRRARARSPCRRARGGWPVPSCAVVRSAGRSRAGLGARRRLGALVGVGAGVDGVQDGQLRVVDRPGGVVEGVGGVGFCPVRFVGGLPGVQLSSALVDLGLDVVALGGGVGLHLRPPALGAVGGLVGLLLGVLAGLVQVGLGLVDALAEPLAGLAGGGLHRRLGRRDALLQLVQFCGEVHTSSLTAPTAGLAHNGASAAFPCSKSMVVVSRWSRRLRLGHPLCSAGRVLRRQASGGGLPRG